MRPLRTSGAPAAVRPGPAPEGPPGTRARRRLGYQPALDGVRGVAWLVVFAAHAGLLRPYSAGQVAMFVFFALSGFLITELLIEEHRATSRVSLRAFFARRGLRLLPALYLFVGVWLVVVLATWGHAPWTGNVPGGGGGPGTQPLAAVEGAGAALFYSMNWLEIHHAFSSYVPIGHLWSLAVEEQFYLLWAPVAAVLLRWRGRGVAGAAAALLAAASFVDVAVVHGGAYLHAVVDMGTDTRAGAFLAGAALAAVWSRGGAVVDAFAGRWRLPVLAAVVGVMAWSSDILNRTTTPALFAGCFVAVSLASGALVLAVLVPPGGHRKGLLASKVLTYLGRRSYALYLWHYVWITWFRSLGTPGIVLAFVASLASAEVSWRLVERPALARKARFTPGRRPTDALAGAASPTSPPPSPSSSELSERRVRV